MRRGVKLATFAWLAAAVLVPAAAYADLLSFRVHLNGASEVPPVTTDAKGSAIAGYDSATKEFNWVINYSGLSGPVTAAEFHGPAAKGRHGAGDVHDQRRSLQPDEGIGDADRRSGEGAGGRADLHQPDHRGASGGEIRSQVIPST